MTELNVPTLSKSGERVWLYPDRRKGPNATLRRRIALVLITVYFMMPWLSWNGRPLLRFDIDAGIANIFGLVFRMSDTALVAWFFVGMGLLLFLATSIRGRIWCGFACPQTVFVEWLIRPVEEWIEGPAHHRRVRDKGPLTIDLALRKVAKHAIFLFIAGVVANTFLAYFVSPVRLSGWMMRSPAEHPQAFAAMSFVLLIFYADLAWFREQFCAFVCPYARFQSVLFDRDTPAVFYDSGRGEPRGKGTGKGDCIDCQLCVRVCPTGIDIRNGTQLECIMCNRCIDACDSIMTNLGRPKGLVRLASEREISEGSKDRKASWLSAHALMRPRILFYGSALVVAGSVFAWRVFGRAQLAMTLTRMPGTAYSTLPDGGIGNLFNLRMVNNGSQPLAMRILAREPLSASAICGACDSAQLAPYEDRVVPVMIRFDAAQLEKIDGVKNGSAELVIESVATGDKATSTLIFPGHRN